jgi:hypothetical protein
MINQLKLLVEACDETAIQHRPNWDQDPRLADYVILELGLFCLACMCDL